MGFKVHLVKASEEKIKLFCSHNDLTFYAFEIWSEIDLAPYSFEQPLTWLGNLTTM